MSIFILNLIQNQFLYKENYCLESNYKVLDKIFESII
jgi:hypothetical protein